MSYLVLHIDVEFIVGTVCADNGTMYQIKNGKEDLLWLYFFNNPHQNSISLGKDNKSHCNNLEVNYYGKFFEKIEKEIETFTLRGIEHPIIDLIKESGLLEIIRKAYQQKTLDNAHKIPTLITFSASIGDNAKQKTVEYLKKQGFHIDSYTIPLAELTCYHCLNQKVLKSGNGSVAIFLEATNSTLHLMKLSLTDNYYLMDGKPNSWRGKGIDPRKRALSRFVVNEVNKATGVLSTEDEKEDECERLEMYTDEWLKRLDVQTRNMPLRIPSVSFAKAPNMKKDVMVRKVDLDSDTGQYTQDLKDIFEAFRIDNIRGDVTAVFLLGNCFQSERVKGSFEQMIDKDRLYFYANKDIKDILALYPKIDVTRYASEESRIKERAKAEELKQAEQRALEDRQRKEQEAAAKNAAAEHKEEENRKEAKKFFERAVELEKEGKLEDARVNVEDAIALDKTNKEYKLFFDDLKDKIKKLNDKNELYKKYLSNADNLLKSGDFENALEEYEAAKIVFDNAEIIAKIIEIKRLIKDKEKQKLKITQLALDAKGLVQQKDFLKAKSKINEILSIDKTNADANMLLSEIDQIFKLQEKQFNDLVKSADKYSNATNYEEAANVYNQALKIKPAESYCMQQLEKIAETVRQQKENQEKCEKVIAKADELFQYKRWVEAEVQYQLALNLCPQKKDLQIKINQCKAQIKELEDVFKDLLMQATVAETKGKLKAALEALESAQKMQPEDADIKKRIKNVKFILEFEDGGSSKPTHQKQVETSTKEDDDFFGNKKSPKETTKSNNEDNDFLGTQTTKSTTNKKEDKDNFLKKPGKNNDEDDFLGTKTSKSTRNIKEDKNDFIMKKPKEIEDDNDFLGMKKITKN